MAQTAQINIKVDGKQAEQSVNQLNQSVQGTSKNFQSLRTELRQITNELNSGLEPGSQRFEELTLRAGQLRDTIEDTQAVIRATAGSAIENLGTGLQGVASVGINAFQGITSAAILFGNENENLQKQLVKLQAIANLAQAINSFGGLKDTIVQVRASFLAFSTQVAASTIVQKIYNFVMTETTLAQTKETIATTAGSIAQGIQSAATWLLVAAKKALTTATITSANAMRVLKGAIVATGIGALVVLLGEAINYMMTLGSETESAASKQQKLADAAEKTRQKLQEAAEASRRINEITTGGLLDMQNQLKILEARGADYNVLYEKRIELKNEELRLLGEQAFQENLQLGRGVEYYNTLSKEQKKRAIQLDTERKTIMTDMELIGIQRSNDAKSEEEERQQAARDAADKRKQAADEQKRIAEQQERERQDRRKRELDEFNATLQRQKDAEKELRKLYTDTAEVRLQIDAYGTAQVEKRTEQDKELMDMKIEMDEFERNLIEKATERQIKAEEEKWVASKKPLQDFVELRQEIEKNGMDNLLESERMLLEKKQAINDAEIEDKKRMWEELKQISLTNANIINLEEGRNRNEFYKNQEIREVEMSEKSEYKKGQAILKIRQDYLQTEISILKQLEDEQLTLRKQQYDKEVKLAEQKGEDITEITQDYESDVFNIQKDTIEKVQTLEDAARETRKEKLMGQAEEIAAAIQMYGDMFMSLGNALNDLFSQQEQNRIDEINSRYDTEELRLKSLYDSKIISEEQYNDKVKELQFQRSQDELKIQRQQFEREKKLKIIQATIDTALGIMKAISQFGPPPSPLGIAGMALAGVIGGIQIATISSQQFSAARGGIVPDNGKPNNIDSVPSMLAPGEAVINAKSTSMFPNVLSLINEAGGGVPLVPEMIQQGSSGSGVIFGENQPQQIRAYVVETDVTDTQRRVGRIQRSVEF